MTEKGATYIIVHVSSTEQPDPHVVRELDLVDIRAVGLDMCTIIDVVV